MNNLSKVGAQLRDIWKQLGTNQRLSVVTATLALMAGLSALAYWSSRGDYSLLYGKLSDTESAKVIQALDDAKVPYKIGAGGSSILVPAEKVHVMRMQLAGRGIPRGDGVGFEIFDKPNFGISDFVQRANFIRAVQGELARTIGQIDEIESARVMIVLPENRLLLDKDKHPTASVFLRLKSNSQLPPQSINSIRFLVANSVEGLKPGFVSVVDNLGNSLADNPDNDSLTGLTGSQLGARRTLEQYLSRKAQDMLEKVLGAGQALVRVSAEINFDTITRTEEKFDPDGSVVRTQTKNEENVDSTTASVSGPAGISANTATDTNATANAAAPVTNTRNHKSVANLEYEIGKTTSNTLLAAGGIKHLAASVTVAARYEGTGKERKLVNRTPEELEKLRRIVIGAVGIQSAPENPRGDTLTLEELPFNDQLVTDGVMEFNQQKREQFWWELARNLAFPAAGLIAFVMLMRLFKRTPVQEIPLGVPLGRLVGARNGNGHGKGSGNGNGHWQNEPLPGVVSVEVLNRLLKENPANLTQAIRDWMNKGKPSEN
jgi:flagellar M-ring protein FliF